MPKKVDIVIGLGFGDEGKGLTTDFLVKRSKKPIVVRFNGGHQAGHTVTTKDGFSHIFSHFGSGTLRKTPSYWSKYCTFSPAYLLYEYDTLPNKPKIFIDNSCPVTTHYDVLYNRCLENSRGQNRLGSCGVGFGATIQRHVENGIILRIEDLFSIKALKQKLKIIRNYYASKFLKEIDLTFDSFQHDEEDKRFIEYIEEIKKLKDSGIIYFVQASDVFENSEWESFIFEGAQGILLDRDYGNKPFITQSNSTSKNAFEIISNFKNIKFDIDLYYVSRAYLTRHGGGPFHEFPLSYELKGAINETNINNEFQGIFRKGFLNIDLMNYALACDAIYSGSHKKSLVITCIDHLPSSDIYYIKGSEICSKPYNSLISELSVSFNRVFFSLSPCAEDLA
jgi:adenylosuccinate synthase